jgi:hypothetical protein
MIDVPLGRIWSISWHRSMVVFAPLSVTRIASGNSRQALAKVGRSSSVIQLSFGRDSAGAGPGDVDTDLSMVLPKERSRTYSSPLADVTAGGPGGAIAASLFPVINMSTRPMSQLIIRAVNKERPSSGRLGPVNQ